MQQQQMMEEGMQRIQELEAENQQYKTDYELRTRELEIKAYEAETKRLSVIAKAEVDMEDLHQRTIENAMDDEDIYEGDEA